MLNTGLNRKKKITCEFSLAARSDHPQFIRQLVISHRISGCGGKTVYFLLLIEELCGSRAVYEAVINKLPAKFNPVN